jgi:hypothetical protein
LFLTHPSAIADGVGGVLLGVQNRVLNASLGDIWRGRCFVGRFIQTQEKRDSFFARPVCFSAALTDCPR